MAKLRKAPGMRELSPGRWEMYADSGRDVVTGKRRRVWRRFEGSLSEAKKARAQFVADVSRGRHDGTKATVDDLCEEWLIDLERKNRSPNTIDNYRRHYEHDTQPTLGRLAVPRVTTKMLTDLYGEHTLRGVAPGTVYQIHATISSMMSQACRWGWRENNPAQWAETPTQRRRIPTVPTPEEVMQLIAHAEQSRRPDYARAFFIAATTGIRRGEVCALRAERNINRDTSVLTVTHTIIEPKGQLPVEKEGPKNDEIRPLALDPTTLALIDAQLEAMHTRAGAVGVDLIADPFIFSDTPDGSVPWRPGAITRYFGRLRDRAGLPHLKFKDFRKFMDTYGQELGFSLAQVSLRAGHDPAVASKHYTGRVDESDRALAAALAALLGNGV